MGTHRVERVAAQLRQEISAIIIRDIKDPRVEMASITEVKLSPDLRNAIVRVSVVGEPDSQRAAIAGLVRAKGFIRHELGTRLTNRLQRPGQPAAAQGEPRGRERTALS
jgi:ribosome-binding factor A